MEKFNTKHDAKKAATDSIIWLQSAEGERALIDRMEKAKRYTDELRQSLVVDIDVLLQPMTL